MDNYQVIPRKEEAKDIDPLGILFFFLGALHIYSFFKRKKEAQINRTRENFSITKKIIFGNHIKLILLGFILAAIIEAYFHLTFF